MNNSVVGQEIHTRILIIGAGAAGVGAAAGAAAHGNNITVIERNSYPGGRATASQVGTICGLYLTGNQIEARYIAKGFPFEFAEKILLKSKIQPVKKNNSLFFLPYNVSDFSEICKEYLSDPGVSFNMNAEVQDAQIINDRIHSVSVKTGKQIIKYYPECVIDTSGGVMHFLHDKNELIMEENYQSASRVFTVEGLETTDERTLDLVILRCLKKAVRNNKLLPEYIGLSVIPGSLVSGKLMLKYLLPDLIDNTGIENKELNTRSETAIYTLLEILKQNTTTFANANIVSIAPETGFRTGPRNLGQYVLSEKDVINCIKFNDGIARGSWPIEIWKPGHDVELRFFNDSDYYEIPARCLKSKFISNLFFAGKNISADSNAIASARVIGTCLQTGFAAGVLASDQLNNIIIRESVRTIRNKLFAV